MELKELKASLEAMLFAHAEPLSTAKMAEVVGVEEETVERMLRAIADDCEGEGRGIQLIRLEGAWQLATKQSCGDAVKKVLDNRRNTPLSAAALEVLAIVAYNQPVSNSFIEQVRGVDSHSTVAGLLEKGLIAEAGRLNLPGRPLAFQTTSAFLRAFGLRSLAQLPPLHSEDDEEGQAGLYALPEGQAELVEEAFPEADEAEQPNTSPPAATKALGGGSFIEGEGGAAALLGEEEE